MKKIIILILLLLPILSKAQFVTYCGPWTAVSPITLNGANNQTISADSIILNGANTVGITLNNCTNIHITKCKIANTTSYAIKLFNCTNVTIDSCYFTAIGMGVYAQNCTTVKVNANRILNVNGLLGQSNTGHSVQFDNVNGAGNMVQNNRIQNIAGQALKPHDQISIFKSNGIAGDSIMVTGNQILGGQISTSNGEGGACGIGVGDNGGSYQVVRGNTLVNPGYAGIQPNSSGAVVTSIKIDHNIIYSSQTAISLLGISSQVATGSTIEISYNTVRWIDYNGHNSSSINYYYTGPTPVNWTTNISSTTINSSILANPLWNGCSVPVSPPIISYTPSTNIYTVGMAISNLIPSSSGGIPVSYSISPSLPAGLNLNTSTGIISGTPTTTSASTNYTVTATNTGGSGNASLTLSVIVAAPNISYIPSAYSFIYKTAISAITPLNTGGPATSWSATLPAGLSINSSTGVITGTPTQAMGSTIYSVTATNASGSSSTNLNITVQRVNLFITAVNKTRPYGSANPVFTFTYSGFVGGDNSGSLNTLPIGSTSAVQGSNIGSYVIVPSGASSLNYNISYVNGILNVTSVPLMITANNATRTYGASNPAFSATYSGFVNGDTPSVLLSLPTFVSSANILSPVGNYTITPFGAISINYVISYTNGVLSITKTNLNVMADNKVKTAGTANPTLTATINGFVNGETKTVLTTQPTLSTTAVTGSPAGTYPITPSNALATNYNFTYIPGTMTVNPVPQPPHAGPVVRWFHRFFH